MAAMGGPAERIYVGRLRFFLGFEGRPGICYSGLWKLPGVRSATTSRTTQEHRHLTSVVAKKHHRLRAGHGDGFNFAEFVRPGCTKKIW